MLQVFISALLLSVACTAMGQPDDSPDMKSSTSAEDSTFLQHAAAGRLAEIQMGKMALDKSSDAKARQLAQRTIDDTNGTNDQLKMLARNKQVMLPTGPSPDALKEIGKLQAKSGSAFDQAWSKAMVKDDQAAAKLFTQENKQTKDTDLHKFTQATLPTLQAHLKSAQELAAVSDARDKAMDQTTKSLANDPMSNMPAATAPTVAAPAVPVPAPVAKH
ncbi:hypothetical protein B0E50_02165 [Rhodanobacter sp. C01]|nr:hypothetical protein B0E50_02165 [Rhodanobacter sp. C01]